MKENVLNREDRQKTRCLSRFKILESLHFHLVSHQSKNYFRQYFFRHIIHYHMFEGPNSLPFIQTNACDLIIYKFRL